MKGRLNVAIYLGESEKKNEGWKYASEVYATSNTTSMLLIRTKMQVCVKCSKRRLSLNLCIALLLC